MKPDEGVARGDKALLRDDCMGEHGIAIVVSRERMPYCMGDAVRVSW